MVHDSQTSDVQQHLYQIYGMWHVPWWQTDWWLYGCILVALLGLIALVVWYITKKIVGKKRILSPWERALQELQEVQKQGFVSVVYSKEFYTALTHILKTYLHARYGFDIATKTDDEAIALLEKSSFPQELLQPIRTIFHGSSAIKFAHACAIKTQIEQDFAVSRDIIYKTIPVVQSK